MLCICKKAQSRRCMVSNRSFTRSFVFLLVTTIATIATTTMTATDGLSHSAWSDADIQTAAKLSKNQQERLFDSGAKQFCETCPIRIKAQRLPEKADGTYSCSNPSSSSSAASSSDNDDEIILATKTIHFQRHGQGYHNLLCELWREMDMPLDFNDKDPKTNPLRRPQIVDSPLTEQGRQECAARRSEALQLHPQLVVVSPMVRAMQTAQISFQHCLPVAAATTTATAAAAVIPWIAHEGFREEMGLFICNKRRPISEHILEFPDIDFSQIQDDKDTLFVENEREDMRNKSERAYQFLVNFILKRPEQEIAVVCHSAILFHILNAVVDCEDDEDLRKWFLTSEIRSMQITFSKRKNYVSNSKM